MTGAQRTFTHSEWQYYEEHVTSKVRLPVISTISSTRKTFMYFLHMFADHLKPQIIRFVHYDVICMGHDLLN